MLNTFMITEVILSFKLTAEFSGFLLEVFVDLLAGVKIRTPSSRTEI